MAREGCRHVTYWVEGGGGKGIVVHDIWGGGRRREGCRRVTYGVEEGGGKGVDV